MMFAMAAVFSCAPEVKPEQNGGKEDDNTGDNGGGDNTEVVVPPADASKVETYQYPIAQSGPTAQFTDPKMILPSELYTVTVEGQDQFVLKTGAALNDIKAVNSAFKNINAVDQPHICAFGCSEAVIHSSI